ncbi:MAG: PE family protein, partial [Mycobacterium sp.]|uniref:PE family protein n=1 Tax=Mycobacterium sp. TaxID=1785 RepID=UPI003C349722
MSSPWVIAAPEYVAAAASDLANIGSSLSTANVAALVPTSGVLAAGADEVSAMIAALFSSHAQAYQALSAQAASFHAQFVQLMNTGASQYALAEAANASPLLETVGQGAAGAVNSSVQALTGSPLVGGGASAAISSGSSGVNVTPAASVPSGGVTALAGNGAASAPNFAATGGIGGSGVNGGLLPSSAAAVANPIAAGNGAAAGTGGSGGLLSSDAAVDTDGGTASAPVASPLLNTIGTNGLAAGSPSGSAGVSENSGNGGVGRLGAEASTIGGQEGSG